MPNFRVLLLVHVFLFCLFGFNAHAEMSSASYRITVSVLSGGGGPMGSASYGTHFSLGQPSSLTNTTSSSYAMFPGFWNIVVHLVAPGDVNGDGAVDLTDVILGLQVVVGLEPEGIHRTADVNGDGKIGVADVIHVLRKAGGLP